MKLYNTLTRKKEDFIPIKSGEVSMYSCGPTVYNYFHIGNARPFIIFDTLRRYFEYKGLKVNYVQNFTDIDDKMIMNAAMQDISVRELADKFIKEYFIDADGLGIQQATVHPRATENIDAIIELIEKLIDKGYAYSSGGDVYFNTYMFKKYGKLSRQNLEDLNSGARINVDQNKKNPNDFVLWKAQKPGEPAWDSPWGKGRPGWHIECSAMAGKYLGETIDIHSGGQDLVFPHHENEIAQSEAANGKPFARFWLHNGFINVDNEKMSKSAGNFFTVRDIIKQFSYESIRFFMLSAHYRNPINFSKEQLEQAKSGLSRITNCIENLKNIKAVIEGSNTQNESESEDGFHSIVDSLRDKFIEAMDDDINTADAIAVIFEIVKAANTKISAKSSIHAVDKCIKLLDELCGVLGIMSETSLGKIEDDVQDLISKRETARKEKNFSLADEIRLKLQDMGIVLEDTPHGTVWKKES